MSLDQQIDLVAKFEETNGFVLSDYLKESVKYNDLIHLNQINDIKNQEYNHISFFGNYSDLLKKEFPQLKKVNTQIENQLNFVYLSTDLGEEKFKPNHTAYSFPCKYVENLTSVFDGMVMHNNYYILLNTNNKDLELNAYCYTKDSTDDCDYYFFVLLGKIINPTAYKKEDLDAFSSKYNLTLSTELSSHFEQGLKVFFLEIDNIKKIYYLNLNGSDNLYTHLQKTFDKKDFQKFDLENYRKPLKDFWDKTIINEFTDEDKQNLDKLRETINTDADNFLNGFMKIGTIENQKFKFSQLNQDLVLELYLLLNVSEEQREELQGTLWVYQLSDPGNCTNKDIHYLPIRKMFNLGKIYKLNNKT